MFKQRLTTLAKPFTWWVIFLVVLIISGLGAAALIFIRGLVVTNLTDLVPWGLWISIDLSSIALGAGAFLLSAAVYLLKIKRLQPVARTAVFIGLIGYSMAVMTLLLDIGRPDRFWHAVAFWNVHSPLWEVTMCVTFYLTVLVLEVLPMFGGSDWMQERWPNLAEKLQSIHHFAPIFAVIGLGLSLLHQSSLGATYGVLKARPIWYRPGLPVLFIVSAMAAGPAMTVLASHIAGRLTPRAIIKPELLDQVSKFVGWVLVAYLYLRFWDVLAMSYTYEPARTEGLNMLTQGPLALNFWMGEIFLGILLPMIILLSDRLRSQQRLHLLALFLIVGGLVAYRWDTNMVGQLVVFNYLPQGLTPQYTRYIPSLVEIAAGAGVIAYGLLAFTLGVRYLKVVNHEDVAEEDVPVPQVVMAGD
ncbi:MAG: polysulfide reductase NrfD [Ardenticatenaceae bacterium]|nr:polysulfide reductase NrfD [Anaerolineales bacterium]MCB8921873.1 polysulfide reductase NrfD [Ardenticatenaceae bacterium]